MYLESRHYHMKYIAQPFISYISSFTFHSNSNSKIHHNKTHLTHIKLFGLQVHRICEGTHFKYKITYPNPPDRPLTPKRRYPMVKTRSKGF